MAIGRDPKVVRAGGPWRKIPVRTHGLSDTLPRPIDKRYCFDSRFGIDQHFVGAPTEMRRATYAARYEDSRFSAIERDIKQVGVPQLAVFHVGLTAHLSRRADDEQRISGKREDRVGVKCGQQSQLP